MTALHRTPAYYWLLALLLLWAGLLFGGFALGNGDASTPREIPMPAKMASSFVLVVASWSWYILVRPSNLSLYSLLIALGMSCGFLGDLFMAGLIPAGERMLGGMASFGIGHIAYLAALIHVAKVAGWAAPRPRGSAWRIWLIAGLVGWYFVVFRNAGDSPLSWPALGYVLLLASTAGCASELAWRSRAFLPLAGGAALFFVSDLMIALEQFAGVHSAPIGSAIWLTYGPAQMLIVYSTSGAQSVTQGVSAHSLAPPQALAPIQTSVERT
jgi:hypothetical protein